MKSKFKVCKTKMYMIIEIGLLQSETNKGAIASTISKAKNAFRVKLVIVLEDILI